MLNLSQKNKILKLCVILVSILFAFQVLFYHQAVLNWIAHLVEISGVWSWIVIMFIQLLQVVIIPIPSSFITLMSMKMYPDNLIILFVLTNLIIMIGVCINYVIGLKLGKKVVIWVAGNEEDANKWIYKLQNPKTKLFYFLTVLFPVFPDDILCFAAGSIKMNFWYYFFANLIGRAIGLATFMFVFTTIGTGLTELIAFGVVLVVCVILKIIIGIKLKKEKSNELDCDR